MLAPRVHGADADQVESFLRVALGDRGGSGLRVVVEGSDAAAQVFGKQACYAHKQGVVVPT
jgi:hypothetical protein